MMVFWAVASLFLIGALLMLLPPLWRPKLAGATASTGDLNLAVHRDQLREAEQDLGVDLIAPDQWVQARSDIQRRLLEDVVPPVEQRPLQAARRSTVALAVLIPLGSVISYLALGDPQALAPPVATLSQGSSDARHNVTPEQIQKMVTSLAERLKSEPNDAEGWMMLGRSYTALGRYRDAVTAFRRATELAPGNASLLADFADVLGMAQGKRLAGEPARLIQQALDADPRHGKALALAGSVAFEARDYAAARGYWERLIAIVPAGSAIARSVQGSIAEARQLEGGAPAVVAPTATGAAASGDALSVVGEVAVSPELVARISPGDTLFVFARAVQGPRMPLAIVRRPVGAWPSAFTLDDTSAMAPNLRLSGFDKVVIGARISKSGNATPQSGDLTGLSATVAPGARGLRVTIDHVQP
jgi:cytochrome c-type biogenesis protein CcmH